jgi:hypothetical protein
MPFRSYLRLSVCFRGGQNYQVTLKNEVVVPSQAVGMDRLNA